jgi:hypothetical protein
MRALEAEMRATGSAMEGSIAHWGERSAGARAAAQALVSLATAQLNRRVHGLRASLPVRCAVCWPWELVEVSTCAPGLCSVLGTHGHRAAHWGGARRGAGIVHVVPRAGVPAHLLSTRLLCPCDPDPSDDGGLASGHAALFRPVLSPACCLLLMLLSSACCALSAAAEC